jgi:parallel beta-helix repeat protein
VKKAVILSFICIAVVFVISCDNQLDENRAPSAVINATPQSGTAPLSVSFNASASSDPDGDTLVYSWNFGDGASGSGIETSHTYNNPGAYTATLTVDDGHGGTSTASAVITVSGDIPSGNKYYVSPSGNDSNPGTSAQPWKTLQHAADLVNAGDTIMILPGTYTKGLKLTRSGEPGKTIKFIGTDVSTTVIDGSSDERDCFFIEEADYISFENITIKNAMRAGIRLSYSDHIAIKNCRLADNVKWGIFTDFSDYTTIEDCETYGSREEHGIYISNSSDNVEIRRNRCHDNAASGIQINADPSMGGDGISANCVIDSNICYENGKLGGAAINLASVRDSVISNNVIYDNYAGGIAAWDDGQGDSWGCRNLAIINNTIYFGAGEGRWCISLKNGSVDATALNNLIFGGTKGGIELDQTTFSAITADYNIFYSSDYPGIVENEDTDTFYSLDEWKSLGHDLHSVSFQPLQVITGIASFDPHLINNSPAIDSGTPVNLTNDFEGDPRPQQTGWDIGADEARSFGGD